MTMADESGQMELRSSVVDLCTRVFKCPGLFGEPEEKKTKIDEFVCAGCGVCAQICPQKAIKPETAV